MLNGLARLSLIYNTIVLVGVALNQEWVRTRAAGGGFTDFPAPIRLTYALQVLVMIFLLWFLTRASRLWSWILCGTFMVSMVVQLISHSPNERWNAIPALLIALAFYVRAKSEWVAHAS